MALALLKEITSIEQQAEQIEADAQQRAREIVASARKEAADATQKAIEQAELEAKEIVRKAEDKANQDIDESKATTRQQCLAIKENSGRKLDNAVDFIVGRIVTHNDR